MPGKHGFYRTKRILRTQEDMRHLSRKVALVVAAVAAGIMPASAQAPAQKPSFEVASVRLSPNQSLGGTGLLYTLPGGKLTANAAILRVLIFNAYGLQSYYQLIGGPDWMDTARWNIDAKAEGNPTQQQIIRMLQTLLESCHLYERHRVAGNHNEAVQPAAVSSCAFDYQG